MEQELKHETVLLDEAVEQLVQNPSGIYVDGTFGRGGHSRKILQALSEQGQLWVFDKDPIAIAEAHKLAEEDSRVRVVHDSFSSMKAVFETEGLLAKIDGVLLDLGVSSPQIDDAERGFSFMKDGPLDMRMDSSSGESAAQWIAESSEDDMIRVFREYGEERFARRIARAIVEARKAKPIVTTFELVELIRGAVPRVDRNKHPATRVFQAIRIVVNNELEDLKFVLTNLSAVLGSGGRLAVISFHSLEDRLVKRFIQHAVQGEAAPRGLPITEDLRGREFRWVTKKHRPTAEQTQVNSRARSAILRVAEKL